MGLTKEIEQAARRIGELYSLLKGTETTSKIVKKINDIIIFGDHFSVEVLSAAWDYYAYKKGISNSFEGGTKQ